MTPRQLRDAANGPWPDKYVKGCRHEKRAKSGNGITWHCTRCQLIIDAPEPGNSSFLAVPPRTQRET